jgi:hypothetical protein
VRDAVFAKRPAPILDLLVASENGLQVRDWRGQPVPKENLAFMIANQVGNLFQQMLYLRRLAVRIGMEGELAPERVGRSKWYPYHFKNGFGPALVKAFEGDAPSPIVGNGKRPPSLFTLGLLFKGASRFADTELVEALAGFGAVQAKLRSTMQAEALSVWLTSALGKGSKTPD